MIINSSLENDVNYHIAYQILNSNNCIQNMTLSMLAKNAHTSITSVNKFCKMLGFKNFAELKFALLTRNKARLEQIDFHIRQTDENEILQTIALLSTSQFNIEEFKQSVDHTVEMIKKSNKVIILGACFPEALSLHFQEDMLMMGKFIYGKPLKQSIDLNDEKSDTLILIISITGRIQNYFKHSFLEVCQHFDNIIMMSSSIENVDQHSIQEFIQIPLKEDNENGNVIILETLRYIKYKYYQKYVGGQ